MVGQQWLWGRELIVGTVASARSNRDISMDSKILIAPIMILLDFQG